MAKDKNVTLKNLQLGECIVYEDDHTNIFDTANWDITQDCLETNNH